MTLSVVQGFEAARNPEREPGGNDTEVVATTDLSFGLASRTRSSELEFVLGTRLRASTESGVDLDRPGASLSYSHIAPGARIDAFVSVERQDVDYLNALELVELEDGTLTVPEDLEDLQGQGTRLGANYRLAASFGENRPFGWGIALSGTDLSYQDVTSAGLVDSRSHNATLSARFDLSEVLRLDTQLGYSLRDTDTTSWTGTTRLDMDLTLARPADGALRAGLSFALPENGNNRFTLSGGVTHAPNPQSRIDFDLGATFIEGGDTQLVGRLDYTAKLLPTLDVNAGLSRQISESTDGNTRLTTAAQMGLDFGLSRVSSLSVDAAYVDQQMLGTTGDVSEMTLSVQFDRRIDRDWTLSVGASHSLRDTDTTQSASSDRLFMSIGRSWNGRF